MLSANDLKNIGESIENKLQKRSQERGEELANKIIANTANGRGLWIFMLWPAFFLITIQVASAINVFFGVNMLIAIGIGLAVSYAWYKTDFTILHPFWSSVLAFVSLPVSISLFAQN